jgi:hypothetical protein
MYFYIYLYICIYYTGSVGGRSVKSGISAKSGKSMRSVGSTMSRSGKPKVCNYAYV